MPQPVSFEVSLQYEELKPFLKDMNKVVDDFLDNDNYELKHDGAIFGCCSGSVKMQIIVPEGSVEAKVLERVAKNGGEMAKLGWNITQV